MTRGLALRRETLTELTPSELAAVAGGTVPTTVITRLPTINGACLTGIYPTFDGCTGTS